MSLYKNYIVDLTKKEINRFSDEHRVAFLIQEETILKENLMMKGIPLVEYEMIQQIFLENASFYYEVLDTKEDIKFDPRYNIAKVVKLYYERLMRIRSVSPGLTPARSASPTPGTSSTASTCSTRPRTAT